MPGRLLVVAVLMVTLGACSDGGDDEDAAAEDDTTTTTSTTDDTDNSDTGTTDEEPDDGRPLSADEAKAVELFVQQFGSYDDPNGLQFTAEEALCAAEASVEALGMERLVELGFDPEAADLGGLDDTLTAAESDAMYQAIAGCIDLETQLAAMFEQSGMTEDVARCVAQRYLDTGLAEQAIAGDYDPALNEEIDAALTEATEACES